MTGVQFQEYPNQETLTYQLPFYLYAKETALVPSG